MVGAYQRIIFSISTMTSLIPRIITTKTIPQPIVSRFGKKALQMLMELLGVLTRGRNALMTVWSCWNISRLTMTNFFLGDVILILAWAAASLQ